MEIQYKLTGGAEFDAWLATLPTKTVRDICSQIIPTAMEPMRVREVQRVASEVGGRMGGQMAASIEISRVKISRKYGGFYAVTRLAPRDSFVAFSQGAAMSQVAVQRRGRTKLVARLTLGRRYYIPAAVEFGHSFPGQGGRPRTSKDVAPIPALRTGAASGIPAAIQRLTEAMRVRLEASHGRNG